MRILLITNDLSDGGGVNRVISHLSHIFSELMGVAVDIFHAQEFTGSTYSLPSCVNIIQAREIVPRIAPLNLWANLLFLRAARYDFVLSFWTQENLVVLAAFAGARTKVIISEHFSHDQAAIGVKVARRLVYAIAHKLLVLNWQELRYYQDFLGNVELLPNPVIPSSSLPEASAEKENIILGVGHLIERKGFEYLIEAAVAARVESNGWRVIIFGDGPECSRLKALIDMHDASSFITIMPPSKSIENWYRKSKLIVVPSVSEVFSMVIPEAMAHGVVPIAFSADGPSYLLEGHPDLLVPMKDVAALTSTICRLINDPGLGGRARLLMEQSHEFYSYSALATKWKRIFEEAQ